MVVANPSPRPYTFDLPALLPGLHFHRIQGSSKQDPVVNDGTAVSGQLTLEAKDALFLSRDELSSKAIVSWWSL